MNPKLGELKVKVEKRTDSEVLQAELDFLVSHLRQVKDVLILDSSTLIPSQANKFKPCVTCVLDKEWFIDTTSTCWSSVEVDSQLKDSGAKVASKITWNNFKSILSALLTGEHVTKKRQERRLEICHSCDLFQYDGKNSSCGVCGCKLNGDKKLLQLTSYEETDSYGCKHPDGSKWKKNGV